mgnify:FL=1
MAIKLYNPITPGLRKTSKLVGKGDNKNDPNKKLISIKKKHSGRNNTGKITVRHQGAGVKQYYRIIDFKGTDYLDKDATVLKFEHDPNRNCEIMLVKFDNGVYKYFLGIEGVNVGDKIRTSNNKIFVKEGNRMPLEFIPSGTLVSCVELFPGSGAKIARSAGSYVTLMGFDGEFAQLKMPSTEIRLVSKKCLATIGVICNSDFENIRWGKAGRMRYRGIRPTVRGKAMNTREHPHGGGRGVNPIGLKAPKTLWGKKALGVKTRDKKKSTNKFIISRRNK